MGELGDFELKGLLGAPAEEKAMGTSQDARFYAASKTFDPISPKGKSLLIQFEATYEKDIECGGGYLKMGPKMEDATKFGDPTEYSIMFGPDKCGYTKRTHLIFNYKGKNVLKKTDLPYKQEDYDVAVMYRLVVKPDNTVEVKINNEEVYTGKMEEEWSLL